MSITERIKMGISNHKNVIYHTNAGNKFLHINVTGLVLRR